jgi:hypothetical protein
MRERKRTAITIETKRRLVIRSGDRQKIKRAWCRACHADRPLLTVEYAASLSDLSVRQLFRQVESGRLHCSEPPDGPLLCLKSLCELIPHISKGIAFFLE